ncbi:MAG: hypothetical protein JWN80_1304 [Microbacteriaceae bacterium]|jgi:hypothetical protein|nr:hypothetical protein [Microbacteriaceae bacterium]
MATGEENPDFITLPPGLADSATFRLPAPRPEKARPRDDIVFIPTTPPMPAAAAPVVDPPSAQPVAAEPVAPKHSAPGWRLEVPGSGSIVVDSSVFVGRNPVAAPGFADGAVLAVVDPDKSLSKTHALFEADGADLWVTDLHSTNGIVVTLRDGSETLLEAGVRTAVPDGASVSLGSLAITVTRS